MSIFGNAMRNMISARERQAQRYVAHVLSEMGPDMQELYKQAHKNDRKGQL